MAQCFVSFAGWKTFAKGRPIVPQATQGQVAKSSERNAGDKAFALLKFSKALHQYSKALKTDADSLYLIQKIAECYKAMHDRTNAELWFARLAGNPSAPPINKYYYAELLRMDRKYGLAQKYYEQYALTPDSKVLRDDISWMDSIPALTAERGAYKVDPMGLNTPQSEYAPTFYSEANYCLPAVGAIKLYMMVGLYAKTIVFILLPSVMI